MKNAIVNLGPGPLTRRIVAALLLLGTAVATTVLRSEGSQLFFDLAVSLVVAMIALVILHFRWRSGEKKAISPRQARDIFS
jgi:hypothetical protein